ncbi:hypothetical protein HCK01_29240, partial [Streptomyces sp. AA8]|nr:hypothetical protein [Streptomyces telluris]
MGILHVWRPWKYGPDCSTRCPHCVTVSTPHASPSPFPAPPAPAETVGDIKKSIGHGGRAAFYGVYVPKTLLSNSLAQGYLQTKKLQVAGLMQTLPNGRWWVPGQIGVWGERWAQTAPVVRNLAAPGTWLPGQLGSLATGSQLFQRARTWPVVGMFIGDQISARWDSALRAGAMDAQVFRGYSGNQII